MLAGMFAAALDRLPDPISFSGSFTATAVAGAATSNTRTVTVPAGNRGQVKLVVVADVGTITASLYSANGGAFTTFTSGDIVTFANGDTLAIRTTGDSAGESRSYSFKDVMRLDAEIQAFTHTGG